MQIDPSLYLIEILRPLDMYLGQVHPSLSISSKEDKV